jgi:PAS domain S-box-containing protein
MKQQKTKGKILIVDDTPANIEVIKTALESESHNVFVATNGEKAIKRAELTEPDLILLDILMPGIDGYETCRQLKENPKTANIPIIFMSALSEAFDKVKGFQLGAVDYVVKPVETEELLSRVSLHITISWLQKELEEANALLEERVLARTEELRKSNVQLQEEISERKQIEQMLRESEERYRTAIESSNDGVSIVEKDRFIYVNQKLLEIFGYDKPEDLIGKPISSIIHLDDRQQVLEFSHRRQTGKDAPSRYEWKGVKKDGKEIYIEVSASLTEHQGKPISLAFLRDVTKRKELETQLQQSQKMEAIGTLAGGIAHDFNNILGVIIGCTELAQLHIDKDVKAHRYLTQALTAGNRATDLVQQILTFSRQRVLEKKPVQPSLITKEVIKMLRASLPSTIEIRQNIERHLGMVMIDPIQMHQVLINLCTNAAHSMRESGGILGIELSNVDVGSTTVEQYPGLSYGFYVKLSVSDTGHGMSRSVMDRIFDPYFTTKESGEGTGLGLAVAQGIVQSYGGTIHVDSEPGQGTVFHVFFARADGIDDAIGDGKTVALPKGSENILFVDDEEVLVQIGRELLEHLGYTVIAVTSSPEALDIFKKESENIDLVITDMTMPKMTGVELAKELMRIQPDIPIILSTGYSEIMNENKAKALGLMGFVMKPIDINALGETIRKVLDGGIDDR